MSPKNTAAVVPQTPPATVDDIAIMHLDLAEIAEAQAEGGAYSLNVLDLEHIAPMHPSRGLGRNETLDVIIVHHHKYRAYFPSTSDAMQPSVYDKDDITPPACASWDGVTGHGNPGGLCAACPFGQFGGPCKPQHMIYGLDVDKTMPVRISVPTTSVKNVAFLRKAPFEIGKPLSAFVTIIGRMDAPGTRQEKEMTFTKGPDLSADARAAAKSYAASFKSILEYPAMGTGQSQQSQQLAAQPQDSSRLADPTARPQLAQSTQEAGEQVSAFDVDNDIPF